MQRIYNQLSYVTIIITTISTKKKELLNIVIIITTCVVYVYIRLNRVKNTQVK